MIPTLLRPLSLMSIKLRKHQIQPQTLNLSFLPIESGQHVVRQPADVGTGVNCWMTTDGGDFTLWQQELSVAGATTRGGLSTSLIMMDISNTV